MYRSFLLPSVLLIVSGSSVCAAGPAVLRSTLEDQTQMSLTVYSNGRALIRDRRKINLDKGRHTVELQDVSAQMRAETAQFRSLSAPGSILVLEQNLEYDLLSPQKLLEKFIGKSVSVIRTNPTTGADSIEQAEVLAVQSGVVLKMKDRIETGIPGRIAFSEVPPLLRAEPTLALLLEGKKQGEQLVELSYLSDGIGWRADYVAELNESEERTHLTGLVTLTNQSRTSFLNAQLQLMGGDVQTVDKGGFGRRSSMMADAPVAEAMPMSAEFSSAASQQLFEYHLYTLPRPTSVMANQTKQVTLLQSPEVKSKKEVVFTWSGQDYFSSVQEGGFDTSPENEPDADDAVQGTPVTGGVFLVVENDAASKLAMPLPAGTVRVFKKDSAGVSQFIGEDIIRHTPEGERVRIRLGKPFDVTSRRKQTSFKFLPPAGSAAKKSLRVVESGFLLTFKNAKSVPQTVAYREQIPWEWKVVSSTTQHRRLRKDIAEWEVKIPAKGQSKLEFRLQIVQPQ